MGAAYWLLQQTIGETLKEAWLESDSHAELKAWFALRRGKRIKTFIRRLKSKLKRTGVPCTLTLEQNGEDEVAPTVILNINVLENRGRILDRDIGRAEPRHHDSGGDVS